MAKYDWKQLEKEYILSDYKSVKEFLENKNMKYNGNARDKTKGWTEKRVTKQEEKSNKTVEKTIEKESENEAKQIADLKSIANDLALNIIKANSQLETYIVKKKKKTKTVKYDYKVGKPQEETTTENEEIETMDGIVDRQGLKMLASALKDLNEILTNKQSNSESDISNVKEVLVKIKEVANNEQSN